MFVTVNQHLADAHFQLRTRWRDPETRRWQTVDLEGPFTMANAIRGAQAITGACPDQRLYVAIEDLRQPFGGEPAGGEYDMCQMISTVYTETEIQYLNQ